MRRLKIAALVLLTAAVLIGGAYVPNLVARFRDWRATGRETLNPMPTVVLNISRDISSTDKLTMMSRIDSLLPIPESKAGMSGEDVMAAVREGLRPYVDTQLAVYYEDRVEMQPYFVQVLDQPELQSVIWQVTVSGNDADFTFFDLFLDDETGKILRISYTAENPPGILVGEEALRLFSELFFSGLGVEEYWDYQEANLVYAGDNGNAVRFRFEDSQFGEILVDLNVHDHGFYVEFPNK